MVWVRGEVRVRFWLGRLVPDLILHWNTSFWHLFLFISLSSAEERSPSSFSIFLHCIQTSFHENSGSNPFFKGKGVRSSSTTALLQGGTDSDSSLSLQPANLQTSPGVRRRLQAERQQKSGLSEFNFIKVLGKGSFGKVSQYGVGS